MASSAGVLRDYRESFGASRIRLINGSVVDFRSWEKPDNLRGPSAHDVVVDEAGMLTAKARGILSSRRSATLGPIRYIGNPGPTFGEFWLLCEQARDPANAGRMALLVWTWRDMLASLPPDKAREYEAFIEGERRDLGNLFPYYYEAEFETPEDTVFGTLPDQITTLARDPAPHPGHEYVVGWDIGGIQDFTVGIPLCTRCWHVHDLIRFRGIDFPRQVEKVIEFTKHFNEARAVIETNGPGRPVFDYVAKAYKKATGLDTTGPSKRDAVVALLGMFQSDRFALAPLPPLQQELKAYQSKRNAITHSWSFSAPKGSHDDTVAALLVAVSYTRTGPAGFLSAMREEIEARRKKKEGEKQPAPPAEPPRALAA